MKNIFYFVMSLIVTSLVFAANEAIKPDGDGTTESPYVLTRIENLVWMGENIAECKSNVFKLANDIDASETRYWKKTDWFGFIPIGSSLQSKDQKTHNFSGVFDGMNYAIKHLYSENRNSSLFSSVNGGEISNLKMVDISFGLRASPSSGALAEAIEASSITNVHVTGKINGTYVGGFTHLAKYSSFINCSFSGKITSNLNSPDGEIGGLIGRCGECFVSNCRTTGMIVCRSTKDVILEGLLVGGLFGMIGGEKDVVCCYSDMQINSKGYVGGLAGKNELENYHNYYGYITTNDFGFKQCYSNCIIEKQSGATIGGIAGFTTNSVCFNCYYNSDRASGTVFGTGVNSTKIKQRSTFSKWNFSNVWGIDEGQSTPYFYFESGKYLKVALLSNCFGISEIEPEKDGYAIGETVTITAIPNEGATFLYYEGALEGKEAQQTLTFEDNVIVKAEFAKNISNLDAFAKIGVDYPDSGHYLQTADIDLSNYAPEISFTNSIERFCGGIYDGRNHAFKNLCTDRAFSGLFNNVLYSLICNLIVDLDVSSIKNGGGLAVFVNNSIISNCYVSANVVTGEKTGGGMCNQARDAVISKCFFKGDFSGFGLFGGFCRIAQNTAIDQCGFEMNSQRVSSAFCSAGINALFVDCCMKGNFKGFFTNGGLVSNCYLSAEGSFELYPSVNYVNCYFNSNSVARIDGVTGFVSPEDMKKQETYVGWDFDNVWDIDEGVGTPYFRYDLPEPLGLFAMLLLMLGIKRKKYTNLR